MGIETLQFLTKSFPLANLGCAEDTLLSPSEQIFFIFMQFLEKKLAKNRFSPAGVGPSRLRNPGSTTDLPVDRPHNIKKPQTNGSNSD